MLEDFIKLYKKSKPIASIPACSDTNYSIFSLKKGLPVTLVSTKHRLDEIYPLEGFYSFTERHPKFWMIPIATCTNKIVGFIVRGSEEKEYRTIFEPKALSPLFGWESFKDFSLGNPLVLCEGVKDAIYLKQFYPYVLSLNTSSISVSNLEIIRKITDKIILSYDNDDTGRRMSKIDNDMLIKLGIRSTVIRPTHKDCAEYLENSQGESDYLSMLDSSLMMMKGDNCGIIKK